MSMEKYGVEDRKDLIALELEALRQKLNAPDFTKTASVEQVEYLVQREKDLQQMFDELEKEAKEEKLANPLSPTGSPV